MGPGATGAAAHVFVADLDAPVLAAEDRHHLERVLRLRRGAQVTVSDGVGRWRLARLGPALEPQGPVEHEPEPRPEITIAFAVLKGDRPELVAQKLTEVGVDRIVPIVSERCVVRWDVQRSARHVDRLRRITREAAMQCRRARLPVVDEVAHFAEVARWPGATLAEAGGEPPALERPVVLIGPEGGWSPEEAGIGVTHTALGPHILRSETAAIVAGALLVAQRTALG
jgi:16S rRNA (uracil1498-N3)-methyltransferase